MQNGCKNAKNNDKDIKNDIVFDEETTQNNADNDKEQSDVQQDETVCQTAGIVDEQESDKGGILAGYAKHENKGKKALAVVKKYCKRYFIDAFRVWRKACSARSSQARF